MKSSECVQLPSVAVPISCDMSAPQKRSVFGGTVWVLEFFCNEITQWLNSFQPNQTDMDMSLALAGHCGADQRRNDVEADQAGPRTSSLSCLLRCALGWITPATFTMNPCSSWWVTLHISCMCVARNCHEFGVSAFLTQVFCARVVVSVPGNSQISHLFSFIAAC